MFRQVAATWCGSALVAVLALMVASVAVGAEPIRVRAPLACRRRSAARRVGLGSHEVESRCYHRVRRRRHPPPVPPQSQLPPAPDPTAA
jgi:hypothetical protein